MIKKIVRFILLVMIILMAFVVVKNFMEPDLHGGFSIKTYYPEIPDCRDFEKDCNVFEFFEEPDG
ncbi:MAG: hypothetical protein PVH61_29205 [Candidatus Aminicenantes bacterium]